MIVDFKTEKLKQLSEQHFTDEQGVVWYPYSLKYKSGGKAFAITFYATDSTHAEMVLLDIKANAVLDGMIVGLR